MIQIPLFPLGLVLLPGMSLPLHIFEERYKLMIAECLADDNPFGIVLFDGQNIRSVGCTARVVDVIKRYDDGRLDILTRGERRFVISEVIEERLYMEARVTFFEDDNQIQPERDRSKLLTEAQNLLSDLRAEGFFSQDVEPALLSDPGPWSFFIGS